MEMLFESRLGFRSRLPTRLRLGQVRRGKGRVVVYDIAKDIEEAMMCWCIYVGPCLITNRLDGANGRDDDSCLVSGPPK